MLMAITIIIALMGMIVAIIVHIFDLEKEYKRGYNDCIKDIDEILSYWKESGVVTVGIETIRNRVAQEYMEENE